MGGVVPRFRRALSVLGRWVLGTALVTWRYVWETVPLHRVNRHGDERDCPPKVPLEVVDERVQLLPAGYGPLFHRHFSVRIAAADLDAGRLIDRLARDFKHFVPSEVVDVHADECGLHGPRIGDELTVEMPGPWN